MAYATAALTCEMWNGRGNQRFDVGRGKAAQVLPSYTLRTPTPSGTLRLHAGEARAAGMNSRMFKLFLDGTKSPSEMAAIANATGLTPAA